MKGLADRMEHLEASMNDKLEKSEARTRADIKGLADRLEKSEASMNDKLEKSEARTRADIKELRTEVKADIKELTDKIDATKAGLAQMSSQLTRLIITVSAAFGTIILGAVGLVLKYVLNVPLW